jgi:hypothetical protein
VDLEQALGIVLQGLAVLGDAEEATQETGKGGAPASCEELRDLLSELEPHVRAQKLKPCRAAATDLGNRNWPVSVAADVSELRRLLTKYKYADAMAVIASLHEKFKSNAQDSSDEPRA